MFARVMAVLGLSAMSWAASAQGYPTQTVRIVVGYTPGGASDVVARLLADKLSPLLKQPVIVENRPGVGGILGMSEVAKSQPDGHTLGIAVSGTMVTGPHLQRNMPYDPVASFAPVTMVADAPMVMITSPKGPYPDLASLIKDAKARPNEIMFGSGAKAFELAMRLFASQANLQLGSVSYPGGSQAAIDVIAGRVPAMIDTIGAQKGNLDGGELRPIAVLDSRRSKLLPNVPTVAEAGVPGYEAVGWMGLVAPKATPPAIVDTLNGHLRTILTMPDVVQRLSSIGFEPRPSTPAEMDALVRTEFKKWGEVARAAGLAVD
jgi:tripartite-type tricarboxylate transporter receptor subunit TctC